MSSAASYESPYGRMPAAESVATRTAAGMCAPALARSDVVNGMIYTSRVLPLVHEHPAGRPQGALPARTGEDRFAIEDYVTGRTRVLSWGEEGDSCRQ